MFNIMVTLGTPDLVTYCWSPCYWCAPDTRLHLHVPGATGSGEKCVSTHIEPNLCKLQGGEVGLEKQTLKNKK